MKILTLDMLIIKPKEGGQKCDTCPLMQSKLSIDGKIYDSACTQIDYELSHDDWICFTHSITLKPEYNGLD